MFPGNFQKQTLDMSWKKTLISEQYTYYAQGSLKTLEIYMLHWRLSRGTMSFNIW